MDPNTPRRNSRQGIPPVTPLGPKSQSSSMLGAPHQQMSASSSSIPSMGMQSPSAMLAQPTGSPTASRNPSLAAASAAYAAIPEGAPISYRGQHTPVSKQSAASAQRHQQHFHHRSLSGGVMPSGLMPAITTHPGLEASPGPNPPLYFSPPSAHYSPRLSMPSAYGDSNVPLHSGVTGMTGMTDLPRDPSPYRYSPTNSAALVSGYPSSPTTPRGSVSISHNPWISPMGTPNVGTGRGSPTRPHHQHNLLFSTPQAHSSPRASSPFKNQPLSPMHVSTPHQPTHQHQPPNSAPHHAHSLAQPQLVGSQPPAAVPVFRHVRARSDLMPVSHSQPKYRRAIPEGGFMSPLNALTSNLTATYQFCNPTFKYESSKNPRRVLTKPSEGKLNNGYDNSESDYILYVNDVLGVEEQRKYLVLDILGQGTFGQVVKCQNMITKEILAVKVIKNKTAYLNQSMMEVSILDHLNNFVDKNDEHNLLRLKDKFMHKSHLCLVFELLSSNLYELIKQNQFHGLSTNLVRAFSQQLLDSLTVLKESRLIHCDLKPENILLKSLDSPVIKVIDFGSACHERQTVYTYIQSRFYRSPEVILGLPYTTSIDMWSLGCIVTELFLGLPIFPGTSEYNQLCRITETLGMPPNWMIEMGKNSGQFFEKYYDEHGQKHYRLKSREKYALEHKCEELPSKRYFPSTNLREIVRDYRLPRQNMSKDEIEREMQNRLAFVDFVQGLLNLNPFERWTPQQASTHPFITESKFMGPFVPTTAKEDSRAKGYAQPPPVVPGVLPDNGVKSYYNKNIPQPHFPSVQPVAQPPALTVPQMAHQVPSISVSQQQQQQNQQQHQQHQPQQHQPQQPSRHLMPGQAVQPPQYQQPRHQQQMQYHPGTGGQVGSRRQRATTIGQLDAIPGPIQRATALMNPAQLIRAQPSPAYIPPPDMYSYDMSGMIPVVGTSTVPDANRARQQGQEVNHYGEVVRNLEDGLSYMS